MTEDDEERTPDQGAINLFRLITEFVGYLRREEGVPFPRGDLVSQELYRYFVRGTMAISIRARACWNRR